MKNRLLHPNSCKAKFSLTSALLFAVLMPLSAQEINPKVFTFTEYMGYVKKFHPRVKSAGLKLSEAQANLLQARGGFDPKIEVDFEKKEFKGSTYYSVLNSSFKIPTWYGLEIKAGFDNSFGNFINPENNLPANGLPAVGISVPLGQGLWINQRMADVQKAKVQLKLSKAEQDLAAIQVLYEAAVAYLNWKRVHQEVQLYDQYVRVAQNRFKGIRELIKQGDKPAIDSIEAGIVVQNRKLNLMEAQLKLTKSSLELSNFLWLDNNIPLELQADVVPEKTLENSVQENLSFPVWNENGGTLDAHPKIIALENKLNLLQIDRKLKANQLLPKANLGYSYLGLSNTSNLPFETNYKLGVQFSFPLFLRKERGSLKLTQLKIQESQWDLALEKQQLTNKIKAQQTEVSTLKKQLLLGQDLVNNYQLMVNSEERLFTFGESSVFLLNSRETSLVSAQLTAIQLENRYFQAQAELFKTAAQLSL
ncbi:MAG: hypothetical protein RL699_889 [Bacteroidota bacterium]